MTFWFPYTWQPNNDKAVSHVIGYYTDANGFHHNVHAGSVYGILYEKMMKGMFG